MLQQLEDDLDGFAVRDPVGGVDQRALEIAGDPPLADAFGDRGAFGHQLARRVPAVKRGTMGVGNADHHIAVAFLERIRHAAKGSAGTGGADKTADPAIRLVPDLGAGGLVMAATVGDVVELVGPDGAGGKLGIEPLGKAGGIFHIVVGVPIGHRRHLDQLSAEKAQRILLLLALGLRDDDHRLEAHGVGHHGEANAGVAGGAFDNGAAGTQRSLADRVLDDEEGGAVLHRLAGIHELGLAQDGAAGRLRGAAQLDQRRVADGGEDVLFDFHVVSALRSDQAVGPGLGAADGRVKDIWLVGAWNVARGQMGNDADAERKIARIRHVEPAQEFAGGQVAGKIEIEHLGTERVQPPFDAGDRFPHSHRWSPCRGFRSGAPVWRSADPRERENFRPIRASSRARTRWCRIKEQKQTEEQKMLMRGALVAALAVAAADGPALAGSCSSDAGPRIDWSGCSKSRLMLTGIDFAGSNFEGANLTGTDFKGSTLDGSGFYKSDISRVSFRDSSLNGANFEKATGLRTSFDGASAQGAKCQKAEFNRSTFNKTNLAGANMTKADVGRGSFRGANLEQVPFVLANISRSNFAGANLHGVDFRNAFTYNANFEDTDLSGVKNLQQQQLDVACGNEATVLPQGLKKPDRWACEE